MAWARGNYAGARELVEEAKDILTAAGDRQVIIYVLIMLARVDISQGAYSRARMLLEESLSLAREVHDTFHIANALGHLARVYFFSQGDTSTARSLYEEALGLYRVFGPTWPSAYTQSDLSQVVLYQGDKNLASSLVEESLVHLREVGDQRDLARALIFSADIPAFQGDYPAAHTLYAESLKLLIQVEDKQYIAFGLERLGQVVAKQAEPAWAARLWGAAEMLRETMGSPMPPVYRPAYEQAVAAARTQLGEKVFVAAWAQGRTMTPEQVQAAGDQVFLRAREP
ncbi:MAG TPA: tetratricopeptide repeat protein [Ktedonobacteraceae bacterium]|nr:tetratricopeptide repeat protein [Ktedonobacteraceae bacterium]